MCPRGRTGACTRAPEERTARIDTDDVARRLYTASAEADRKVIERVGEVAQRLGRPRAQVALAWVLSRPAVSAPIIGATKSHHLADAIEALSLELSPEDISQLEEPYVPHRVAGFTA